MKSQKTLKFCKVFRHGGKEKNRDKEWNLAQPMMSSTCSSLKLRNQWWNQQLQEKIKLKENSLKNWGGKERERGKALTHWQCKLGFLECYVTQALIFHIESTISCIIRNQSMNKIFFALNLNDRVNPIKSGWYYANTSSKNKTIDKE